MRKKSYFSVTKFEPFSDSLPPEYNYTSNNILFMFNSTMAIEHAFAHQKLNFSLWKNLISSAISTLLTYTGMFRLNEHGFVYFIYIYIFFFHLYIL